jgi:hypothetical protein
VDLIATYGYLLLPDYRFTRATGLWRHREGAGRAALAAVQLHYDSDGVLRWPSRHERAPESAWATTCARPRSSSPSSPSSPTPDQPRTHGCPGDRRLRGAPVVRPSQVCLTT